MATTKTKSKVSLTSKIEEEYKRVFTNKQRRGTLYKVRLKFWANRRKAKESKMDKTKKTIKTTISTLPKFVSLVVLSSGFIYAGWELSHNVDAVKVGVVLLTLFLIRESSK